MGVEWYNYIIIIVGGIDLKGNHKSSDKGNKSTAMRIFVLIVAAITIIGIIIAPFMFWLQ